MEHQHHINNEKKTLAVVAFTIITMAVEIFYGYITNSMALLADGYHMGTHALALGLTYLAYVLIRHYSGSAEFPNGTQKIGTLAAYTSSLFLGITGIWIVVEAGERFYNPMQIKFNEAILVAVIGLMVNAACILVMESGHKHHHHDDDYNFKAAYYHILADLMTSVLAILALTIGKYANLPRLDAVIGCLGGLLIVKWAFGLLKHTTTILIDMENKK